MKVLTDAMTSMCLASRNQCHDTFHLSIFGDILFHSRICDFVNLRYMAPAPPPYDPYGGYPVPPVPMPAPTPVPAPSSYVPVQVIP